MTLVLQYNHNTIDQSSRRTKFEKGEFKERSIWLQTGVIGKTPRKLSLSKANPPELYSMSSLPINLIKVMINKVIQNLHRQ